jgi:two-component system cell cycle sensor histidine kinase PleC
MLKEKIRATLFWAAICIAGAMSIDYVVTILILDDVAGYTPFITLFISTVISLPTTYVLVSSRLNLRRARDELAVARDAAIDAGLSKTTFFANMSHELRTPLNAIIGFSELLETDVFASKRIEYAKLIHGSATHLLELVNDLLDLSKIEAGKVTLDESLVCLADVLDECCRLVEHRVRTARLQLVETIARDLPNVTGDHRALKQIVLNLLTNAIKFTPEGGTVELFARHEATGEVIFGVRDDGIGIAPEEQQLVFERYGRANQHATQMAEGTGLGLPIVKGLVEAHGGRVTLESELGHGTSITIRLPAERVREVQKRAAAS